MGFEIRLTFGTSRSVTPLPRIDLALQYLHKRFIKVWVFRPVGLAENASGNRLVFAAQTVSHPHLPPPTQTKSMQTYTFTRVCAQIHTRTNRHTRAHLHTRKHKRMYDSLHKKIYSVWKSKLHFIINSKYWGNVFEIVFIPIEMWKLQFYTWSLICDPMLH